MGSSIVFSAFGLTGYLSLMDRKNGVKPKSNPRKDIQQMLYGPPTLPATGGGLIVSVAGLIYGSIIGNWIVVILSMVMIIIIRALIRLRRGEQEIRKRDQ